MPFIIDGHNLIAALPDLDLSDPEDERKLVEILQGFCSRTNRRATVYFDRGVPGGEPEAPNWTIVSSDREVIAAARRANASVLHSDAFGQMISTSTNTSTQSEKPLVAMSDKDLAEWEKLFKDRDQASS
jgi:hypothetical protein